MKKIWAIALLLIAIYSIQNPHPTFAKSRNEYEKTGHVIWEVNTDKKIVAITFDDGPHPVFTPQILDLLAKYDAKATFFVAGNKVKRFPEVLKREVAEGHEIANHTYNHIYSRNISAEKLTTELDETDAIIQQITGQKPKLYRPVGGLFNELIVNTAVKNNKLVVLWSWHQDPKDWRNTAANQISRIITTGVQPGNIILLHDWHGNDDSKVSQTVLALDDILSHLYKNGYKCVTVSELLYQSNKTLPDQVDPFK
ncbi:polysaccharide deacetylase family protein [Bacillus massiliigorillae]|uniref:polysaccharide deacetylase family protein n=1 Tax=Bacillus massiliigorillae TaxID=1243664 RepID=UPI0003A3DC42|nr:polysaccharide deacetylase family protein [Bacillus massiliigorillae]